jgi:hypothetical protein
VELKATSAEKSALNGTVKEDGCKVSIPLSLCPVAGAEAGAPGGSAGRLENGRKFWPGELKRGPILPIRVFSALADCLSADFSANWTPVDGWTIKFRYNSAVFTICVAKNVQGLFLCWYTKTRFSTQTVSTMTSWSFFFAKRVNIPAHLKATYFILPAILLGNVAKQRWWAALKFIKGRSSAFAGKGFVRSRSGEKRCFCGCEKLPANTDARCVSAMVGGVGASTGPNWEKDEDCRTILAHRLRDSLFPLVVFEPAQRCFAIPLSRFNVDFPEKLEEWIHGFCCLLLPALLLVVFEPPLAQTAWGRFNEDSVRVEKFGFCLYKPRLLVRLQDFRAADAPAAKNNCLSCILSYIIQLAIAWREKWQNGRKVVRRRV